MELRITPSGVSASRETLTLTGSIDLTTRDDFVAAGRAVLDGGHDLVLDMAGIEFIDSTGIGAIIELHTIAQHRGATFLIPQRSDRVNRILEVTGLSDSWVA